MNVTRRKIANALLGLAAGLITLPLAILAWPILAAWFLMNDSEDEE